MTLPYDPWADLARRIGVEIKWHTGRVSKWEEPLGVTNFNNLSVTLLAGMSEGQLRATLAHELVHLERGPVGLPWANKTTASEEATVHLTAAKRLVSPADYMVWTKRRTGEDGTREEARKYCRVDRNTVLTYHRWRQRVTVRTAVRVWEEAQEVTPAWPPVWLAKNTEQYPVAARFAGLDA